MPELIAQQPPLLTVTEAANRLRLSKSFLNNARVSGHGPAFVKLGARVLYRSSDLEDWVSKRQARSTSDTGCNR